MRAGVVLPTVIFVLCALSGTASAAPRLDDAVRVIDGYVTAVHANDRLLEMSSGGRNYRVTVARDTAIRRYIYPAQFAEMREGDWVTVHGLFEGSRVDARRIQINRHSGRSAPERPQEVTEGEITYPASSFDRTFAIETQFGERKIDVPRGAVVIRNSQPISVHDLRRGEYVQVYGTWDGSTMTATAVEVIGPADVLPPVSRVPKVGADEALPPKPDATPLPPIEPEVVKPDAAPAELDDPSSRTGRIVEIDYDTNEITLDVRMQDVKVSAAEAAITRRGSSRRFSDLKEGDKVTVRGEVRGRVFVATAVEIIE